MTGPDAAKTTLPFERREFDRLGETLDRIVTIDVANRGAILLLYEAARRKAGRPLSTLAAARLAVALAETRTVLILTGFPVRPWISPAIGETDGPPGAAALAWALCKGMKAIPVVVTPDLMVGQVAGALRASGILVVALDEARRAVSGPREVVLGVVEPFTRDAGQAELRAPQLMERLDPAAVLAIEHPGANARGVYHSGVGLDVSIGAAKAEPLFRLARSRGVLTISFADMPNEIGLGSIAPDILDGMPYARKCQCPCGGGIAAASVTDHLVMATTANWAAYATVAALSVMLQRPDIRYSRAQDERAIAAVLQGGGVEGRSGSLDPLAGLDGIPTRLSGHILDLLDTAATNWRSSSRDLPRR